LPNNGFRLSEWVFSNGNLQSVQTTGTFAVGTDCSLKLTFDANGSTVNGGTTGAFFVAPTSFRGLLVNPGTGGLVALQPDTTSTITGQFIAQ
jgi:hypothetical protein